MREIKFRAWDANTKEMVDNNCLAVISGKPAYIMEENSGSLVSSSRQDMILMQYTGLKDSEGIDIYEGDILSDKWRFRVYFKNGSFFAHSPVSINQDSYLHGLIKSREVARSPLAVIGNIHTNPELLK